MFAADRPGPSDRSTSPSGRAGSSFTTCPPSPASRSGSASSSARSWPIAPLGREPGRVDPPLGLRGAPVAEPVEPQGAIPLRRRPIRPRPLARPRPDRGLPRAPDGRPDARRVPPPGTPPRGGGRQRPPDQDRGPVPRQSADLQPAPFDGPPDLPDERPALAAPGPADSDAGRDRNRSEAAQPVVVRLVDPPADRQDVASWFHAERRPGVPAVSPAPGYAGGPSEPRSGPDRSRPASSAARANRSTSSPQPSAHCDPPPPRSRHRASAEPEPSRRARTESSDEPPLKAFQVHDSYLIAETADGMMVIDQHALHERILYEELRQRVERGPIESQRLLVPEPVHLTADEASAVLEQREVLGRLGLEVEPFGGDTVLVTSTPAMLAGSRPERLLRDLAEHFRTQPLAADARRLAGRLASHGRVQGGRQGRPAADPRGDRRLARSPAPGRRRPPLPPRPADGPGLHQVGAGAAIRADLNPTGNGKRRPIPLPRLPWRFRDSRSL